MSSLTIKEGSYDEDGQHDNAARVGAALVAAVSRPVSPLQCLELLDADLDLYFPNQSLGRLLRAVENSRLERFAISDLTEEEFNTLMESIPLTKVEELDIVCSFDVDGVGKQALLQVLKRNYSIRSLKCRNADGDDVFSGNDKERLRFYPDRNARLEEWTKHPTLVPRPLWPQALHLAREAGRDSLYVGLRAVMESDIVLSQQGKRKRNRPRYFDPSDCNSVNVPKTSGPEDEICLRVQ